VSNKKIFLYIGLAVGGFALYEWWKGNQGASVVAPPVVSSSETAIVGPPASAVIGPALQSNVNVSAIDPATYQVVANFLDANGMPPALAMLQAEIPSEFFGMDDIITNAWNAGVQPSAAQQSFWVSMVNKYDPTHKYWTT
jgi:hypothetical protein